MKNSIITALFMLFTFSTAGIKAEKSECHCSTACSLPCLQSESCSLLFDILAFNNDNGIPLSGNFLISITSPKGKVVSSLLLDASAIQTDDPTTPSHFQLTVPAPICAGNYVVSIQNVSVPGSFFMPFYLMNVSNSCNSNILSLPVPQSFLGFIDELHTGSIFAPLLIGESTEVKVYIPQTFVPFEACKTECKCEKE